MTGSFYDKQIAYEKVKQRFPGEVCVVCLDLGNAWLFNFRPKGKEHDRRYIRGHFGEAVNKETGEIFAYDIVRNWRILDTKVNLVGSLKD